MATSSRLNLTRDQLASFLSDHEQIKQFERLFALVNELQPTTLNDLSIAAGNAEQKAIEALDLIASFAQTSAIDTAIADQKGTQALTALSRIADALELLASAPTTASQCIAQDDLTPLASVIHVQDDLTPPLQLLSAQDDLTPPAERHNSIDYLDFNPLAPAPANVIGRVHWNGGTTLGVQMTPNVLQRVGESEFVYIKASAAITKGQLCYHTGAVGSSGVITAAPTPLSLADPNQIVGVAAESIALNDFGLIQISGDLRGFNTTGSSVGETWADGDPLYYNPAYVGSMTKVKPVAPNQKSYIGEVINAGSGGSGSMHIRIVQGSVLGGTDSNVEISGVANNDVLVYDSTDLRWENKDVTTTFNLPALAANGVLYLNASKVATSGSALTFDGSNLGIGTNSPGVKLDVRGASGTGIRYIETTTGNTNRIELGAESGVGFIKSDAGGGSTSLRFRAGSATDLMALDSSGNLGLGVTPSSWGVIGPALQVKQASLVSESFDQLYLSANAFFDGSWKYMQSDIATQYYQASGTHVWRTAPSGTAGNAITFTEAARVTETNNQVAYQPAESAQNTSVTLTVANLQTRIITSNAAVTLTLPTGTTLEGYTSSMAVDTAFECTFIATTANAITIGANGNTTVGSLTVAGNSSGLFRFRKTATNTFTVYRIV